MCIYIYIYTNIHTHTYMLSCSLLPHALFASSSSSLDLPLPLVHTCRHFAHATRECVLFFKRYTEVLSTEPAQILNVSIAQAHCICLLSVNSTLDKKYSVHNC